MFYGSVDDFVDAVMTLEEMEDPLECFMGPWMTLWMRK